MRTRVMMLAAVLLVLGFWSAMAQLKLSNRPSGAGESTSQIYNERFTLSNALDATKRIDRALHSFTKLSTLAKTKLTAAQMKQVGNTDWETQNLGFVNWVGSIEGTLRKQHYQIAQLQLEVATAKAKAGKLNAKELQKKQAAYRLAERDLQRYIDNFSVAD